MAPVLSCMALVLSLPWLLPGVTAGAATATLHAAVNLPEDFGPELSEAIDQTERAAKITLGDYHLDAKLYTHLHPFGTGSLRSQSNDVSMQAYLQNRLLSLDHGFRHSPVCIVSLTGGRQDSPPLPQAARRTRRRWTAGRTTGRRRGQRRRRSRRRRRGRRTRRKTRSRAPAAQEQYGEPPATAAGRASGRGCASAPRRHAPGAPGSCAGCVGHGVASSNVNYFKTTV